MSESIREINESEIPACAAVIRESFGTVAKQFGLTKENAPTNAAFLEAGRLAADRQRGVMMYALCDGDAIVGFVALEARQDGAYYLEKLAVLPDRRHQGYGKALIDFAVQIVASLGGARISIGIIEENTRLKEWYARCGFVATGTKTFAHLPFTVGFMELPVGPIP